MFKLRFFVHCNGWATGGYENTIYFEEKKQAESWLRERPDCERLSLDRVSDEEFATDYICAF